MAQYCVAFESAKKFLGIKGTESVGELVSVIHTHALREWCCPMHFAMSTIL